MLRQTVHFALVATFVVGCGGDDEASTPEQFFVFGETPDSLVVVDDALWVLDPEGGELLRLDATDGSISARVADDTGGDLIQLIDGSIWLLGSYGTKRIDPSTANVVASTDVSYSSLASVNGRLFANRDGDLYELDPNSAEELTQIELPEYSPGSEREVLRMPLAASGDTLWVGISDGNGIAAAAFDPESGTLGPMRALDAAASSTVVIGDRLWLLGRDRKLRALDAETGEEVDSVNPLPDGDSVLDEYNLALAVGPDGSLWAVDQPEQVIYMLDPATGDPLAQFALTYRPDSIFVTDDSIWISNHYDGCVTRLPRSAVVDTMV